MHSTSEQPAQPQTLMERSGTLGLIKLNRPKALNSLTLDMVRDIDAALDTFERDPNIAAILLTGQGERGLCAGGDIRAMYDGGKAASALPETFWREEYRLNARINRYQKPYIDFMDGIVMGGGVGISVYGSHRIVTERTRLAMPETGIGFFPDVGASWFLTRQPNELATYIALTGEPLGAADSIASGLADSHMPAERLPVLIDALSNLAAGSTRQQVSSIVAKFSDAPPTGAIVPLQQDIDRLLAFDSIDEIVHALESDQGAFAQKTAATLRTKSPISLNVTLGLLRLGRTTPTLEACLEREFAATRAVLASHDFYEGVRAAIIDKDRNPRWRPARLDDVSKADIAPYFPPSKQALFAN